MHKSAQKPRKTSRHTIPVVERANGFYTMEAAAASSLVQQGAVWLRSIVFRTLLAAASDSVDASLAQVIAAVAMDDTGAE